MQDQLLHAATMLAFVLHIAAGTIGLASGLVAVFARKGGRLHQRAGSVFFGSMLVMAAFAACLAVVRPGQLINLFIAAFTAYLIVTAWATARRRAGGIGTTEKIGFAVGLVLCAPFVVLSFQLVTGMTPMISAKLLKGPVAIAVYVFTSVLVIAALGDLKVLLAGGISGVPRIARHLWRMCLGLTLAIGSFTTNALPRVLPGHIDHSPWIFAPQLLSLGFLVFWMIRVRVPGWRMFPPRAPARA